MFSLLVGLSFSFAAELARCTDLKQLHSQSFLAPKVYAPSLYALQKIPYSVLEEAGVGENATWLVSEDAIWLSHSKVNDRLLQSIVKQLWPKAISYAIQENLVVETTRGRWTVRQEAGGILLSKNDVLTNSDV